MENLEFEIELFIKSEQKRNGNSSGTSLITISSNFEVGEVGIFDLKQVLNKLHRDKKIVVKKGLNQLLIFLPK